MTVLNFPSTPTVDDTYTANGVTYLWNGSYWAVANTPSAPDSLQTVTDVGNTTTNNIDIGPGNITLSASGSGEFSDYVTTNFLSVNGPDLAAGNKLSNWSSGEAANAVAFYGDGTAEFKGKIRIGGDVNVAPNIELNATGSAVFTDSVLVSESGTWLDDSAPGFRINSYVDSQSMTVKNPSTYTSSVFTVTSDNYQPSSNTYQLYSDGSIKIGGLLPDDPKIKLARDGSAVFKSVVTGYRFASQVASISSTAVATYTLDGIVVPSYTKSILCCSNGASPTQVYEAGMWTISRLINGNTTQISGTSGVASVSCDNSGVISVTTNTASYRSLSFTLLVL